MNISISARGITRLLALLALALAMASIAGQYSTHFLDRPRLLGFVRLFNLDEEANVPTWYSSMLLFLSSVLLATIAVGKRRSGDPFALHWGGLAIAFLCFSVDEVAMLHELIIVFRGHGLLFYPWVVPGSVFVCVFVLVFLRFLIHLPVRTRRLFVLAGALFVGGGLGVESLAGRHDEIYGFHNMTYAILVMLEELLEMLGVVVFIHALLSYLGTEVKEIRVCIESK